MRDWFTLFEKKAKYTVINQVQKCLMMSHSFQYLQETLWFHWPPVYSKLNRYVDVYAWFAQAHISFHDWHQIWVSVCSHSCRSVVHWYTPKKCWGCVAVLSLLCSLVIIWCRQSMRAKFGEGASGHICSSSCLSSITPHQLNVTSSHFDVMLIMISVAQHWCYALALSWFHLTVPKISHSYTCCGTFCNSSRTH